MKLAHRSAIHPEGRGCSLGRAPAEPPASGEPLPLPEWEWAEADPAGVVFAANGALFSAGDHRRRAATAGLLRDFNADRFEPRRAICGGRARSHQRPPGPRNAPSSGPSRQRRPGPAQWPISRGREPVRTRARTSSGSAATASPRRRSWRRSPWIWSTSESTSAAASSSRSKSGRELRQQPRPRQVRLGEHQPPVALGRREAVGGDEGAQPRDRQALDPRHHLGFGIVGHGTTPLRGS